MPDAATSTELLQQLHAIAAASPFAVVIRAVDGRLLASNAEWVRLSGWSIEQTPTLTSWAEAVRATRLRPAGERHPSAGGATLTDGYNVITTASGEQRICEIFTRQLAIGESILLMHTAIDVTRRLEADVERVKFNNLLGHSTDMIAFADVDGRLTYMNAAGRQLIGLPSGHDLRSLRFTDYIPEDWRERFTTEVLPAVHQHGLWEGEMQLQNMSNGERIDVARSMYLVRDAGDKPVGFGTIIRNITVRKKIEEALRRNAELIRTIAENSTQGLAMMDERGYCTYANPALLEMTGYTSEDLPTKQLHYLIHNRYPDGRPFPMEDCPIDRALPDNFDVRACEDFFFTKDGTMFPVLVAASPIFKDGRPVSTVIEVRDMTEARRAAAAVQESEERFRALADNIAQLAWMADAAGWIFWYNKRWFDYTGTTLDQMEGWGWRAVHHPDHVERVLAAAERGWPSGEPWEETFPLRRHDGEYRWFLTRTVPVRDADGKVLRWLGTNTDITDLREAQEALLHTAEKLREADRLKDEFLATLSHELRTPLTAILGWTQMLKLSIVRKDEAEVALDTIHRSAKAQADLIEDVLDISRITTGKMRLERRLQDPATVAEAALATVAPAAEAKEITLRSNLDRDIGPMYFDPDRMQQMLWNLLSNAIKFSGAGSTVELTLRPAGSNAEFEVRDEGCGISPEFLPHLFERFRQADSSTRRAFSGLGLGLALVKELAQLHGGTVSVTSEEGKGSVFTLSIPMVASGRVAVDEVAVVATSGALPLAGVHVLVVDDHPDARLLISTILRKLGAIATEAGSAEDAMSLMERARPQVVLTDIAMPERNGFDLLAEIRARSTYARVPVVAITAQVERQGEGAAIAAGFAGYLRKPIDPEVLAQVVADAAARR